MHVRRCVEGDRDSLEWLVSHFSPFLLVEASYRLRGHPDIARTFGAEDLVNDVWFVVLPRLRDLDPRAGRHTPVLVKFLSNTLLNKWNNLLTKHLRRHAGQSSDDAMWQDAAASLPAESTEAIVSASRSEVHDRLVQCLAQLDENDRDILVMRGMEQLSYDSIGTKVGQSSATLRARYSRACARLRHILPQAIMAEFDSTMD